MPQICSLKKSIGILLFWASVVISQPLLSAPHITGIEIKPTHAGDILIISYQGGIDTLLMTVDTETHATVSLSQASISPTFKPKNHKGKLIKNLTLESGHPTAIKISIDFKRRLGRHSRNQIDVNGQKTIQIELLDELPHVPVPPEDRSVIQPVIEPGVFEIAGTKNKKPLDYNKGDRKKISTEEFLALFETKIRPRPNRITDFSYTLTHESLRLVLTTHQKPIYTIKSQRSPAMIKFKLTKTLGDIEINHTPIQHRFMGDIHSIRKPDNSLEMRANLYETTETNSRTIKNPDKPGYLLIIDVKRIYPWETETAIPDIDIR